MRATRFDSSIMCSCGVGVAVGSGCSANADSEHATIRNVDIGFIYLLISIMACSNRMIDSACSLEVNGLNALFGFNL